MNAVPSSCRFVLVTCIVAAALVAQEKLVVAGPEPGTLRLGDTARAEIRIVDPQGQPREFTVPQVDGLRMRLSGPSQYAEYSSFGTQRTSRITLTWTLDIQPTREGRFTIPAFAVWTGSKEQQTRPLTLDVKQDLVGAELGWLDVTVAPQRVYVHEPIRVHVEAGVKEGLRLVQGRAQNGQGYFDVEVQASWLEEFPGGERIELPSPKGVTTWMVQGNMVFPVQAEEGHDRNGERWLRFAFDRAFLPTRVGTIELAAPMLRYHVMRRDGGTDPFGLPRRGTTEQYFVPGKPVRIEVLPIPEAGRPTPYYGAVGRFTIDAALDRDSVRVGNSVKLTLTVRGQGNLEFLRLPPLDALPGLHKLGQAEAKREADKVVVTYDLSPRSADVREVPAIEWNYFDTTPGVEQFVTVATKPLPLRVEALPAGAAITPLPDADVRPITPGVDSVFDLPSLDGPPVPRVQLASWLAWTFVSAPLLAVLAAAGLSSVLRRRRADVVGQRARRAARTCEAALRDGGDVLDAFAGYLGDRLGVPPAAIIAPDLADRLRQAGLDEETAAAIARLVEQGTAARYGGGAPLTAAAVRDQVQRLEGKRLPTAPLLPLLLVGWLATTWSAPLASQSPTPATPAASTADPVALYRAQQWNAAEAAFARAFADSGDRRLWRARGNCFFHAGDLPRALWAYECARLGLPRDAELQANLRLVRARLQVDVDDAGLFAQLGRLRGALTPSEQLLTAGMLLALAGACFVFGWRRVGLRFCGGLVTLPAVWLAAGNLVGDANALPRAVALQSLELVAEPRGDLAALATVRPGVVVDVLGGGEATYVRVRAGDHVGYALRDRMGIVQ